MIGVAFRLTKAGWVAETLSLVVLFRTDVGLSLSTSVVPGVMPIDERFTPNGLVALCWLSSRGKQASDLKVTSI